VTTDLYEPFRLLLSKLASELFVFLQGRWTDSWSLGAPRVGIHYDYWDLKSLPSFGEALTAMGQLPSMADKYDEHGLEGPLGMFLELVVASAHEPSFLSRALDFWWPPFHRFLQATQVPIRLFLGLCNFEAAKPEYRLDTETTIRFFGEGSLYGALQESLLAPVPLQLRAEASDVHLIHGAAQIDFSAPASRSILQYHHYTHECIHRMQLVQRAISLCSFGRIEVAPWIPIANPDFPVEGVSVIGAPKDVSRYQEPTVLLDDNAWARFQSLHSVITKAFHEAPTDDQPGTPVGQRFASAISRFLGTFEQGYWDSVVVDLVIAMESLLTPNRQGGRMQLALAASNLLGTSGNEATEVFENVSLMYRLRNQSVHGEPVAQQEWDNRIPEIAQTAGSTSQTVENGTRQFAFEVMRDYARRVIAAMLHLSYEANMPPSSHLTRQLHRLHLDPGLAKSIHKAAHVYSFGDRPAPPS